MTLATGTQVCSLIFSDRNFLQESTHPNAGGRREDQADAGREGSHLAPLASLQGLQSLQVVMWPLLRVLMFFRS